MINYIQLVEDTEDGKESPFKAMAILNELAKEIKQCQDQIKEQVIEEAAKYDKTFEKDGFKIEQRNGRRVWNFKEVDEWKTYDKGKKDCEERLKVAYSANEKGLNVADQEGEIQELPICTFGPDVVVINNLGKSLIH